MDQRDIDEDRKRNEQRDEIDRIDASESREHEIATAAAKAAIVIDVGVGEDESAQHEEERHSNKARLNHPRERRGGLRETGNDVLVMEQHDEERSDGAQPGQRRKVRTASKIDAFHTWRTIH